MSYKSIFWIVFSIIGLSIVAISFLGFEMQVSKTVLFGLMMAMYGTSYKKGLDE